MIGNDKLFDLAKELFGSTFVDKSARSVFVKRNDGYVQWDPLTKKNDYDDVLNWIVHKSVVHIASDSVEVFMKDHGLISGTKIFKFDVRNNPYHHHNSALLEAAFYVHDYHKSKDIIDTIAKGDLVEFLSNEQINVGACHGTVIDVTLSTFTVDIDSIVDKPGHPSFTLTFRTSDIKLAREPVKIANGIRHWRFL